MTHIHQSPIASQFTRWTVFDAGEGLDCVMIDVYQSRCSGLITIKFLDECYAHGGATSDVCDILRQSNLSIAAAFKAINEAPEKFNRFMQAIELTKTAIKEQEPQQS